MTGQRFNLARCSSTCSFPFNAHSLPRHYPLQPNEPGLQHHNVPSLSKPTERCFGLRLMPTHVDLSVFEITTRARRTLPAGLAPIQQYRHIHVHLFAPLRTTRPSHLLPSPPPCFGAYHAHDGPVPTGATPFVARVNTRTARPPRQLGRDVPFRAIQLTSYELLRKTLGGWRKRQQEKTGRGDASLAAAAAGEEGKVQLSSADAALVGGVAGAISATITCPLDVLRTRLMVGGGGGGGAKTWTSAIKAGSLFSGLGTRVLYVGTSSAVFFVVYEAIKTHLGVAMSTAPAPVGKEKREQ